MSGERMVDSHEHAWVSDGAQQWACYCGALGYGRAAPREGKRVTLDELLAERYADGYRAGAEAMRKAAVALCDSPDVTEIDEYAECISVLPIELPPERDSKPPRLGDGCDR